MAKIRKGDKVIVLTGKDKGKQGEVLLVLVDAQRVVVQGVNMVKRHSRQQPGKPGGIIEKEGSIHSSNIALIDPKSPKQGTRVGFKVLEDGKKVRVARRSGEVIDA
ncbi:MAG TPA: 50S ribosomal protein L24 [Stellaceae bacterium]|jgi:large subunit ribosomal protein L24|nr:50S ribosomal protein L24 [Stellaceae bacterium]